MKASLNEDLVALCARLEANGFEVSPLVFKPPAKVDAIDQFEKRLGCPLPPSFRWALTDVSRHVEFNWLAPDITDFPEPLDAIFSGGIRWSLELIKAAEDTRRGLASETFADLSDPEHAVWHDKLAFMTVPNGDLIAFDLRPEAYEQVVYLNHELYEGHGRHDGHGYVLAHDLRDLIERWMPLAFVGSEDWQWLPFTSSKTSGLEPDGANGRQWRQTLGIADREDAGSR